MSKFNIHLNDALLFLDSALEEIEGGFVRCENCGEQEDTKDLDFVDELKLAKKELLKAIQKEITEKSGKTNLCCTL